MDTARTIAYIIGLVIFVYMVYEVWRSPMGTGEKILWTILAFLFTLITLIVWFVWGRKRAYSRA